MGIRTLMESPPLKAILAADSAIPAHDVELKAANLPRE
jgi:hypothetical protein